MQSTRLLVHRPLSNSHFFQKPTPPEFSEVKLGLRVALVYNDNACLHKKLARLNGRTTKYIQKCYAGFAPIIDKICSGD